MDADTYEISHLFKFNGDKLNQRLLSNSRKPTSIGYLNVTEYRLEYVNTRKVLTKVTITALLISNYDNKKLTMMKFNEIGNSYRNKIRIQTQRNSTHPTIS